MGSAYTDRNAWNYASRKIFNPCKDCVDRAVGCHSSCERHKSYKGECETAKKAIRNREYIDDMHNARMAKYNIARQRKRHRNGYKPTKGKYSNEA